MFSEFRSGKNHIVASSCPKTPMMSSRSWQGAGTQEEGIDVQSGKTIVKVDTGYFRPAEVEYALSQQTVLKKYSRLPQDCCWVTPQKPNAFLAGSVRSTSTLSLKRWSRQISRPQRVSSKIKIRLSLSHTKMDLCTDVSVHSPFVYLSAVVLSRGHWKRRRFNSQVCD